MIPVLLPDAPKQPELPTFLSGNTWVEFQEGLDVDDALWRLECGIRGESPGRGRPKPEKEHQAPSTTAIETIDISKVDAEITAVEKPVYVFISYRHQDLDSSLAHAFENALKRAGHQAFIDTGISWGANWAKEIQKALGKC
ncbi:MAG: TIR domain-containing protein, partial [Gammaproteobacteria bacterium]|nr:TIR domain-containing protein [Gammaproteobacteria bacterium]